MSTLNALDIDLLWAQVEAIHATADLEEATSPVADLTLVLRSQSRRRDLRRFLILIGAIEPGNVATPPGPDAVSTDVVVGKLMGLNATQLRTLIGKAGRIHNPSRVEAFADAIAALDANPTDAIEVFAWLGKVSGIITEREA